MIGKHKNIDKKRILIPAALLILILLFFAGAASAADIYVNGTGGKDTNNGTSWALAKQTISSGTTAVTAGGTVYIANGVYNGSKNYGITISKNMNIIGESQTGTIIDAQQKCQSSIFSISSSRVVTIQNLTIQNGGFSWGSYGSGIKNTGTLTVTDTTFTGNNATWGGAISNTGSGKLTVTNSTFTGNTATWGGAIDNEGGTSTVTNSTFTGNTASRGGAISNSGSSLTVNGSTFNGNTATYGGAIYNIVSLTVISSNFTNNTANEDGGAIYNDDRTSTVTGSTFTNNTANGNGGAIENYWGTLTVTNSTFTGNTATGGGAIDNDENTLTVSGSTFTENSAQNGGAIANIEAGTSTVNFNRFYSNTASQGKTIYCDSGSVNAENNWWGSNNPDFTNLLYGNVDHSPWIMLILRADPDSIEYLGASNVTADLTWNTINGIDPYQQPTGGHVPDGISADFCLESGPGTIDPTESTTQNGKSKTEYTNNALGTATISTQVDDEKISINIPVDKATTNVTVNPVGNFKGQNVTLKANVTTGNGSTINEGQVRFTVNNTTLDPVNVVNGVATLNWQIPSNWNVGLYQIFAEYLGTTNYTASNSTGNLTVTKTPTNTTVNNVNSFAGQTVTLVANVTDYYGSNINGGQVQFKVNNTNVGTVNVVNGVATLNWQIPSNWNVGIYQILAEYLGTGNYTVSNGTENLTVTATPTNTTVNPVSNFAGQTVDLTAHVTDYYGANVKEGQVQFLVNGINAGTTTVNNGIAILNWQIPANWGVGLYQIFAEYLGTTNYTVSNATSNLAVTKTPTNTTVNPVSNFAGQTVNLIAHVTDYYGVNVDKGKVRFTVNSLTAGTVDVVNGTASIPDWKIPSSWKAGIYQIFAEYLGTGNYTTSNATNSLTVIATPTKTTVVNVSNFEGQPVNLIAHVTDFYGSNVNEGQIKFTVNNITAGTANVNNGVATLNWQIPSTWNVGIYTILAKYLGTGNYTVSNATNNLTVTKTPSKTTVSPVSGYVDKIVVLKANVAGSVVNEGQVQFKVNNKDLGGVYVKKGVATLNWLVPSSWKANKYTIVAKYLGTAKYLASNTTSTLTLKPTANLVFTKSVSKGTYYFGNAVHYYLAVKNNGPDMATGVSVYDKLPSGLKYQSSTASKGSYKSSVWTIGTLGARQTAKLTINAMVNQVGTVKNTATLSETTYPQKKIQKSVSFSVSRAVPFLQLVKASGQIKAYSESHNYKIPSSLKVAGQTLTMPQLLKLFTTATINISKKNFKPISVTKVGNPPYPGGFYVSGKLYTYLNFAQYIKNFINTNKRAPNYADTNLGKIPFSKLVYMYSKVVNYYGQHKKLPNWVATYKI